MVNPQVLEECSGIYIGRTNKIVPKVEYLDICKAERGKVLSKLDMNQAYQQFG